MKRLLLAAILLISLLPAFAHAGSGFYFYESSTVVRGALAGDGLLINTQASANHTAMSLIGNLDNYYQLYIQNLNSGTLASADFVATSDAGDEDYGYIDLGINSSNYSDPAFSFSGPHDGYLYVQGPENLPAGQTYGDLSIGTKSTGTTVNFFVGGTTEDDLKVVISTRGIILSFNTILTFKDNSIKVSNLYISSTVYSSSDDYYTISQTTPAACITGSTLTFTTVLESIYRVSYFGSVRHSASGKMYMAFRLDGILPLPFTSTMAPMLLEGQAGNEIPASWSYPLAIPPGTHQICFVIWSASGSSTIPQNNVATFAVHAVQ